MAAVMTTPMIEAPLPREAGPTRRPHLTLVAAPRATAGRRGIGVRETAATYRRRRLVVAVALVAVVLAAGRAGAALGGSTLAASERPPSVTRYVVQPGDSLWSIAQQVAPGEDLRPVVDRLAAAHGGGALQPGETIVLR
jgi:Tfp pilus assembly protein FimV